MKTILVMSGKGGVGKTTIAVNLSQSLLKQNFTVGLLDVDMHGPNVLKMLGLDSIQLEMQGESIVPYRVNEKFKVSSIASFVNSDSAVIWRGPLKHKAVQQLTNIDLWGELDYLIVDFPPGTGDEHISTAQTLKNISGAVIVSTPQNVSILDTLRSVDFCKQLKIPILGLIENMSGEVFGSGSVEKVCAERNIPFLGRLPLTKEITLSCEEGKSFVEYGNKKLNDEFEKITKNIIYNFKED
jgi:Mrp family chromosome partitioning ATPase